MGVVKPVLLVLAVTSALVWISATQADAGRGVHVKVGQSIKVHLPRQPRIIGIEDPSVAAMTVTPNGHALVRGIRPGKTRIIGRDFAEVPIIIPVTVTRSAAGLASSSAQTVRPCSK